MKNILFTLALLASIVGCSKKAEPTLVENSYKVYGDVFEVNEPITPEELEIAMNDLEVGDSMAVQVATTVESVCQQKGCWMKFALNENETVMAKFKDHAFFIPMDSEGQEIILNGKAYKGEVSVDQLKHYAEDAGKSQEEIDAITEPEVGINFEASGVHLVDKA